MTATPKINVGVIGCGNISRIYLQAPQTFGILNILACADLNMERARTQAAQYTIPRAISVEELLADPEIELVINLRVPKAHAEVGMAALQAGKHLYTEKPLALSREQGRQLLTAAHTQGLRVGGAPDTFLGGGLQTCRLNQREAHQSTAQLLPDWHLEFLLLPSCVLGPLYRVRHRVAHP